MAPPMVACESIGKSRIGAMAMDNVRGDVKLHIDHQADLIILFDVRFGLVCIVPGEPLGSVTISYFACCIGL